MIRKTILMFALLVIVLTNTVQALGISPAQTIMEYKPGTENRFSFRIINTDNVFVDLRAYKVKEISNYITLEKEEISLDQGDQYKEFFFSVNLPPDFSPGEKVSRIVIEDRTPKVKIGENHVSVIVKLAHKVIVNIPQSSNYIVVDLNASDVGDSVSLEVLVKNEGTKDIGKLETTFHISDGENQIKEKIVGGVSLNAKDDVRLKSTIEKDFGDGEYKVSARVKYDENSAEFSKKIIVGEPKIEIMNFQSIFIRNKINQLPLRLKSNWNKPINDINIVAYALVGDKKSGETRSSTFDIEDKELKDMNMYLDLRNITEGEYPLHIDMGIGADKVIKNEYKIVVLSEGDLTNLRSEPKQEPMPTGPDQNILILLSGMIGGIVAIGFIAMRMMSR